MIHNLTGLEFGSEISEEPDSLFRPPEAMESSDFDISHRRMVEESDNEPQERIYLWAQEQGDYNVDV